MSLVLNSKDSGFYDLSEFVTGQLWFPNQTTPATTFDTADALYRQSQRIVVFFPNLPNATSISQPHNISVTSSTFWVKISGAATNSTTLVGISLPYISLTLANSVQVDVNATLVTITTAADYSAYNGEVVLEYLQN